MSDIMNGYEEFSKISDEAKQIINRISSRQRHDFMNMLQIITGCLQIEEFDRALKTALEYGQRTESLGRLQKHGLLITSYLIEYYTTLYSNFENRIELMNNLPPTEPVLREEKREALQFLEEVLSLYEREPMEKVVIVVDPKEDNTMLRIQIPEQDGLLFMSTVLKYKSALPELELGVLKTDISWNYLAFPVFDTSNGG